MLGWLAAVFALAWGAAGLLWVQVLVLPHPYLPPRAFAEVLGNVPSATSPERFVVMILKETSLSLCAFALLGLAAALLAHRAGARRVAVVAALLCAAVVIVSLIPVAQAWRTATAEDASLSFWEYAAGSPAAIGPKPETVTYSRAGGAGEELRLDLWRPPGGDGGGDQSRPAVIVVHGGGWRSGGRGEFPLWNQWLARKGYVVFDIDYRLDPPPTWRDAPADVECAVAWVKENSGRYGVDPDRVALMGRSAGGHLALLAAYATDQVPRGCDVRDAPETDVAAVVAFYPPTDLVRLDRLGYLPGIDRFLGGPPGAVSGRYRDLSPITRVDPGDPPTFLVHGGGDEVVPSEESAALARRLRGAGVPHQLVELPWANHTFDFIWGGWGGQITRFALGDFLGGHLESPDQKIAAGTDKADPRRLSKN